MTPHLALTLGVLGFIVTLVVIAILIAPNDLPPKGAEMKGRSRGRSP